MQVANVKFTVLKKLPGYSIDQLFLIFNFPETVNDYLSH